MFKTKREGERKKERERKGGGRGRVERERGNYLCYQDGQFMALTCNIVMRFFCNFINLSSITIENDFFN